MCSFLKIMNDYTGYVCNCLLPDWFSSCCPEDQTMHMQYIWCKPGHLTVDFCRPSLKCKTCIKHIQFKGWYFFAFFISFFLYLFCVGCKTINTSYSFSHSNIASWNKNESSCTAFDGWYAICHIISFFSLFFFTLFRSRYVLHLRYPNNLILNREGILVLWIHHVLLFYFLFYLCLINAISISSSERLI